MTELVKISIDKVNSGELSFCRFITANDTGETGGHQEGFYIPKSSYSLFFNKEGIRGSNNDKFIKIKWQDDFETGSRAIYYGVGTRNEYRLTRFGRDFPFLTEEYTGALLIITRQSEGYYSAFVLNNEDDIESFLENFSMSPADTNGLIIKEEVEQSQTIEDLMNGFIDNLPQYFPDTSIIALSARNISNSINKYESDNFINQPDKVLVNWLHTEYELFKKVETHYYSEQLTKRFNSVTEFIDTANSILNRRKSRAGKSLEHHLDAIFKADNIKFSHPGKTEGNKKPDFIFPGNTEYHLTSFNKSNLTFLGAKTTCKDRWRQILNEAARIPVKHLFTLQQGISKNQLEEMYDSNVVLVVPSAYISTYPREYTDKILNLKKFIELTKEKQLSSPAL